MQPVVTRVNSATAPQHERFDYWQSLFPDIELQPLNRAARCYDASLTRIAGDQGVSLIDIKCPPTAARFRSTCNDFVRLDLDTAGQLDLIDWKGRDVDIELQDQNSLKFADYNRLENADSLSGYSSLYLYISPKLIRETFGTDAIDGKAAVRALPRNGLANILRDHAASLCRHISLLTEQEALAAIDVATSLTKTYLRSVQPDSRQARSADDALSVLAKRYIARHLDAPDLTIAGVAKAIGCSRAHLYRIFDGEELSIANHVRERRLERGRDILKDPQIGIEEIAYRCGYADASAFGKAFRRHFGVSPRGWRSHWRGISG